MSSVKEAEERRTHMLQGETDAQAEIRRREALASAEIFIEKTRTMLGGATVGGEGTHLTDEEVEVSLGGAQDAIEGEGDDDPLNTARLEDTTGGTTSPSDPEKTKTVQQVCHKFFF